MKNKRKGTPVNRLLMGYHDFFEDQGKRKMLEPEDSPLAQGISTYRVSSEEMLGHSHIHPEGPKWPHHRLPIPHIDSSREIDEEWCPTTDELSPYSTIDLIETRNAIVF